MMKGAQIVVNPSVTFTVEGGTIQGCNFMWKSILLGGNSSLDLKGGVKIMDAHSVVESNGDNTITINGAEFRKNYYGLNIQNCMTLIDPTIGQLLIDGTGPFKPSYAPIPFPTPLKGEAGFFLKNLANYNITATDGVLVRICEFGAFMDNSGGHFENIDFNDIRLTPPIPAGSKLGGTAVYLKNCALKNTVLFRNVC